MDHSIDDYSHLPPELVPVYLTKDKVIEVKRRLSGGARIGDTDSVSLQHYIIQFGEASQNNMLVKETYCTRKKYLYISRRDNLDSIGSRNSKAYFSKGNFG